MSFDRQTCSVRLKKDNGFDDTVLFLDIDECSDNSDNCSRSSTDCQNFQGGYECKCKSGYKYIQGDKFNCERKHAMYL